MLYVLIAVGVIVIGVLYFAFAFVVSIAGGQMGERDYQYTVHLGRRRDNPTLIEHSRSGYAPSGRFIESVTITSGYPLSLGRLKAAVLLEYARGRAGWSLYPRLYAGILLGVVLLKAWALELVFLVNTGVLIVWGVVRLVT